MITAQRRLLEAVDSLQRERRAPVPDWLIPVAVAVNVIGGAERDALVKRVRGLIDDGLLSEARDHPLGAGIEVTAQGRQALAGLASGSETPDKPKPSRDADAPYALPDDDHLLAESYALVLDCADALARHQHTDSTLLSLYQRIETHCKTLWQRQEQKEASCAD
ncbi:hypothetical protein [Modicisalibacter sp. MOD 31.J]|uniref:hypothetical protein n=1 Tax=Modicisalibacter sp. MOD 31.J TaxID=2831897 RepID=UPI001CCD09EF|nr:hypothetical protein [Modicisalibacter sp. MOD 31.J]MBZ9574399.1 hypothetical protein [Modicisalibacter sp. MOD 31.J]